MKSFIHIHSTYRKRLHAMLIMKGSWKAGMGENRFPEDFASILHSPNLLRVYHEHCMLNILSSYLFEVSTSFDLSLPFPLLLFEKLENAACSQKAFP